MGRAERRRKERYDRIQDKKDKVTLSRSEISDIKREAQQDVTKYNVEALLTCFALTLRRVFKFGPTRIMRALEYLDGLMGDVINDEATIEDYKKMLEDETGVRIKFGG